MALYKIEWTEETWNRVFIEADSSEEAQNKFLLGEFPNDGIETFGAETQDGYDVEEV